MYKVALPVWVSYWGLTKFRLSGKIVRQSKRNTF